ncbi:hypothetical protein CVS40_0628 [Lucilia cuprina]|nr:hypothetical protein CVS40_0628 [Lucilia cuprina]
MDKSHKSGELTSSKPSSSEETSSSRVGIEISPKETSSPITNPASANASAEKANSGISFTSNSGISILLRIASLNPEGHICDVDAGDGDRCGVHLGDNIGVLSLDVDWATIGLSSIS